MSDRQTRLFTDAELPPNLLPWEIAAAGDRFVADVVFNRPLSTIFQYLVPNELRNVIGPGQRIQAPFGRGDKPLIGYCVGLSTTLPSGRNLKTLTSVLDREALVDARMLELTRWIADRYLCGWGQVLNSIIPAGVKQKAGTRELVCFALHPTTAERMSDRETFYRELKIPAKQRAVLESLAAATGPMAVDELSQAADCGIGPIQGLRDKGLIVAVRERRLTIPAMAAPEKHTEIVMNPDQRRAVDTILQAVRSQQHQTLLLHGVTGSGKTEVYIKAIEEIVSYGRQAIVWFQKSA